jgi:4-hydroxy-tetrahydrodipicolinate synthase
MTLPHAIRGVFTPNIVPLDDRGEINEPELRRYIDWLIGQGAQGLYPNGSTGEFLRFTPEERRRIIAIVVDQTAGRVPILAGAAEANPRETILACERYHELGARAVAIVSPFYYRLGPASVYAYFKEIADHTPIDVTLYNIPMFASPIDVETVRRLAEECPRVVAIKDSSGDLPHMMRMIQAVRPIRPEFAFLTGWDASLAPMLMIGCDGATLATAGVAPQWTRRIFDLVQTGHWQPAIALQQKLLPLFDAMIGAGDFPDGFREGVRLRGFKTGRGRQPSPANLGEMLAKVGRALASFPALPDEA